MGPMGIARLSRLRLEYLILKWVTLLALDFIVYPTITCGPSNHSGWGYQSELDILVKHVGNLEVCLWGDRCMPPCPQLLKGLHL